MEETEFNEVNNDDLLSSVPQNLPENVKFAWKEGAFTGMAGIGLVTLCVLAVKGTKKVKMALSNKGEKQPKKGFNLFKKKHMDEEEEYIDDSEE